MPSASSPASRSSQVSIAWGREGSHISEALNRPTNAPPGFLSGTLLTSLGCVTLCSSITCAGTLVLMMPDMLHLMAVFGMVIIMEAMLVHVVFGQRLAQMSEFPQSLSYWAQYNLLNFDL